MNLCGTQDCPLKKSKYFWKTGFYFGHPFSLNGISPHNCYPLQSVQQRWSQLLITNSFLFFWCMTSKISSWNGIPFSLLLVIWTEHSLLGAFCLETLTARTLKKASLLRQPFDVLCLHTQGVPLPGQPHELGHGVRIQFCLDKGEEFLNSCASFLRTNPKPYRKNVSHYWDFPSKVRV